MKALNATAWVVALILAGPAAAVAAGELDAADGADSQAVELKETHRARAEQAQAEAAQNAADAVLTANRLDLDIRLIGPTSIAGDL
jgi:hypothetical protein